MDKVNGLTKEVDRLQNENNDLSVRYSNLNDEMRTCKERLQEAWDTKVRMSEQIESANLQISDLKLINEDLQSEMDFMLIENDTLRKPGQGEN